jgi:hypothetical protein
MRPFAFVGKNGARPFPVELGVVTAAGCTLTRPSGRTPREPRRNGFGDEKRFTRMPLLRNPVADAATCRPSHSNEKTRVAAHIPCRRRPHRRAAGAPDPNRSCPLPSACGASLPSAPGAARLDSAYNRTNEGEAARAGAVEGAIPCERRCCIDDDRGRALRPSLGNDGCVAQRVGRKRRTAPIPRQKRAGPKKGSLPLKPPIAQSVCRSTARKAL